MVCRIESAIDVVQSNKVNPGRKERKKGYKSASPIMQASATWAGDIEASAQQFWENEASFQRVLHDGLDLVRCYPPIPHTRPLRSVYLSGRRNGQAMLGDTEKITHYAIPRISMAAYMRVFDDKGSTLVLLLLQLLEDVGFMLFFRADEVLQWVVYWMFKLRVDDPAFALEIVCEL